MNPAPTHPRSRSLDRLLEIYRKSQYRTTTSGRKVQWDEPSEGDSAEVRRHNAFLDRKLKQKRDAKDRLKKKGAVPTKQGKPIFEEDQIVTEDLQQVLMGFRYLYQTNRMMRFSEWVQTVADLLDDL